MKRTETGNSLYRIEDISKNDHSVKATVQLYPSHEVFKGHFPGNPILPGVCIIQVLKEIAERSTGMKLMISRAESIKYLSFINPELNNRVVFESDFNESDGSHLVFSCTVSSESSVFCRLKGEMSLAAG